MTLLFGSLLNSYKRIVGQEVPQDLIQSGLVKILPHSYKFGILPKIYPVSIIGHQLSDCDEFLAENKIHLFKTGEGFASIIDKTKPACYPDSQLIENALFDAFRLSALQKRPGLELGVWYLLDPEIVEEEIQSFKSVQPKSRFVGFMSSSDVALLTLKSGKEIKLDRTILDAGGWVVKPELKSTGLQVFSQRFDINIQKTESHFQ